MSSSIRISHSSITFSVLLTIQTVTSVGIAKMLEGCHGLETLLIRDCGKEITNESMPSSLPPLLSPSPCHLLLFFLLVSFIDFFSPPALQLIGEYLQIILLLLKLLLHVLSVFSSFFFLYSPPFLPPFSFCLFLFLFLFDLEIETVPS